MDPRLLALSSIHAATSAINTRVLVHRSLIRGCPSGPWRETSPHEVTPVCTLYLPLLPYRLPVTVVRVCPLGALMLVLQAKKDLFLEMEGLLGITQSRHQLPHFTNETMYILAF